MARAEATDAGNRQDKPGQVLAKSTSNIESEEINDVRQRASKDSKERGPRPIQTGTTTHARSVSRIRGPAGITIPTDEMRGQLIENEGRISGTGLLEATSRPVEINRLVT